MTQQDNGGTAISLRDYFAGQAFAGIIARGSEKIGYGFYEDAACRAYRAADALLAARSAK